MPFLLNCIIRSANTNIYPKESILKNETTLFTCFLFLSFKFCTIPTLTSRNHNTIVKTGLDFYFFLSMIELIVKLKINGLINLISDIE